MRCYSLDVWFLYLQALDARLSIILQQDPKLFEREHYMCKKPLPLLKKKSDVEI
jgi:hypothetical protein